MRHGTSVQLDRYAPDELADILAPRARKGLTANAVDRRQLEVIADRAAGSARRAIQGLHATAVVADERGRDAIADADIPDGLARARRWIREANIASLPYHHQVFYELIRDAGEIRTGELRALYETHCETLYANAAWQPIDDRYRRNILDKLEAYDLIESEGETRWKTFAPADPSLKAPVELDVAACIRESSTTQ